MPKLIALVLLVATAHAAFTGPLQQRGRVVELKRNSVVIIDDTGARVEVPRSSIKNGNKLKAGDDVVSEMSAEEAVKALKQTQKPKKI
jgi:hypothetical protein